ncbi:MAG TPA: hypothetical protein VK625_01455, partial [Flavitalea sp.]|nr:hypothetical protein [Flavitalea sp.]
MKKVYTLVICTMLSSLLLSQSQKLRLYDADTKEPLIGATIRVVNSTLLSSQDGSFVIPAQSPQIEISFAGYDPVTIMTLPFP